MIKINALMNDGSNKELYISSLLDLNGRKGTPMYIPIAKGAIKQVRARENKAFFFIGNLYPSTVSSYEVMKIADDDTGEEREPPSDYRNKIQERQS